MRSAIFLKRLGSRNTGSEIILTPDRVVKKGDSSSAPPPPASKKAKNTGRLRPEFVEGRHGHVLGSQSGKYPPTVPHSLSAFAKNIFKKQKKLQTLSIH